MWRSVDAFGPIDLVVAWIHDVAPETPLILAESLAEASRQVQYFHVLGSAVANPNITLATEAEVFARIIGVSYHRVILGFRIESDGSRWLIDDEISSGILKAIAAGQPEYVVGVVRPWSARP